MRHLATLLLFILPLLAQAQQEAIDSAWLLAHYNKKEVFIPMRDGKRLFTAIYSPKSGTNHPILINRTPYSVAPYGEKSFRAFWKNHYMAYFRKEYIMVFQDVRGRYMSEGEFMDVRPYNHKKQKAEIDEASDTYDAVDWLLRHTRGNNGRVGVYGISYPGFYATMAALSGHPAIKAVSPQAPVTEWFLGDDFHHNGAFMQLDAFGFYSSFGKPRPSPTTQHASGFQTPIKDNYQFFLQAATLSNLATLMGDSITFWKELYQHPNYDAWWQTRDTRSHVQHIPPHIATLVVGGLFDAEDCYGAWNLYKAIEGKSNNQNTLVMGPWTHGGWAKSTGSYLGNVRFGTRNNSEWYQKNIEIPFFNHHLLGAPAPRALKEANIYFTGANKWESFRKWPPQQVQYQHYYLSASGGISRVLPAAGYDGYSQYTSNPAKPVPYTEDVHAGRTAEYMADDQRFAARRPDVLVFQTDVLQQDLTLAGPITANLFAAISTTDADFVVKLIDVFPDGFAYNDTTDGKGNGKPYPMGGYQMLVRGEIMRGRYRNSFSDPAPFEPGKITKVSYQLPDVAHVFRKGHRLMVQVQSTWFPLADRNPQQFVDIYHCTEKDFVPCDIKLFSSSAYPSSILLPVLGR